MDSDRVKQIIESKGVINVLYKGFPVWLEGFTPANNVEVTNLKTNEKLEVPVDGLIES